MIDQQYTELVRRLGHLAPAVSGEGGAGEAAAFLAEDCA
jgi:hypothetical protein